MITTNPCMASEILPILCFYINTTSEIQIARLNSNNINLEKIIFPGDRLLFEALPDAELEIHIGANGHETLCEKIPCLELIVKE